MSTPLTIAYPICKAEAGEPCLDVMSGTDRKFHLSRQKIARNLSPVEPSAQKEYRMLEVGEIIESCDEWNYMIPDKWVSVEEVRATGRKLHLLDSGKVRRPIPASVSPSASQKPECVCDFEISRESHPDCPKCNLFPCDHHETDHGICLYCGEDRDMNSDHFGKVVSPRVEVGGEEKELVRQRDEAADHAAQCMELVTKITAERDSARAQVEELRRADKRQREELVRLRSEHRDVLKCACADNPDATDGMNGWALRITAERDSLIARLEEATNFCQCFNCGARLPKDKMVVRRHMLDCCPPKITDLEMALRAAISALRSSAEELAKALDEAGNQLAWCTGYLGVAIPGTPRAAEVEDAYLNSRSTLAAFRASQGEEKGGRE